MCPYIYGLSKHVPVSMECPNMSLYLWIVKTCPYIYGLSKHVPISMECPNMSLYLWIVKACPSFYAISKHVPISRYCLKLSLWMRYIQNIPISTSISGGTRGYFFMRPTLGVSNNGKLHKICNYSAPSLTRMDLAQNIWGLQ